MPAAKNTNEAKTAALGVPFPKSAIQVKRVPGRPDLSYVAGHTYIHRLIDSTENIWDWTIKSFDARPYGATSKGNPQLLLIVTGTLTIPGLGSRDGMGVQVVTADSGGEDMWKGAQTDAIKAASKLFGVGLELYGPDYEAFEPADPNPGIADRRSAPSPHTQIDAQALRDTIVNESKAKAETNDKRDYSPIYAAGKAKGLKPGDVKAIGYAKYNVKSLTELTGQQLFEFNAYLNDTKPDALKVLAEDLIEAAMEVNG